MGRAPKDGRRLRVSFATLLLLQPFRFGGLVAGEGLFGANGETGAALVGFAAFGLRASLLPRRWDLAIFFSFGGVRRRNREQRVAYARVVGRWRRRTTRAPDCTPHSKYSQRLRAGRSGREIVQVNLPSIYR